MFSYGRTGERKRRCFRHRIFVLMVLWVAIFLAPNNSIYPMPSGVSVASAKSSKGKVSLSKNNVTVNKGFRCKIKIKNAPSGAKISWKISNKAVASIKAKGAVCVITGKKAGQTKITARVNNKKYICRLTVKNTMALSVKSKTIKKGETFILSLKNADSGTVKWSVSSKILRLTRISKYRYRVTGSKIGMAYVIIRVGNKRLKCKVTVAKSPSHSGKDGLEGEDSNPGEGEEQEKEPKPLIFYPEWSENLKLNLGGSYIYSFNIPIDDLIKSISFSRSDIVSVSYSGKSMQILGVNPGETVVTITDIYDRTYTSNVTVTQVINHYYESFNLNDSDMDYSLPVPVVENVYYSDSRIVFICPGTFGPDDPYTGYEVYMCSSRDFDESFRVDTTIDEYNGRGYGVLDFPTSNSGTVYYKVRAFRIIGNKKICGPWGTVGQVIIPNYSLKSDAKPTYSYEVYFLDKTGTEVYNGIQRAVYIKTDNPDPSTIGLISGDESVIKNIIGHYYDDIKYLQKSDYDELLKKVEGGYVGYIKFAESGMKQIQLREYAAEGYRVVSSFNWIIKDYEQACDEWIDDLILKYTTPSMGPFEKMEAICNYLTTPGLFKYVMQSNQENVTLASVPNGPFFRTYRWDSYTTPTVLCRIAERIGGFTKIHNCFGDYPMNSPEWSRTHYYAELTYDGETRRFQVCPNASTGDIGEVKYIDFSDISSMTRADR